MASNSKLFLVTRPYSYDQSSEGIAKARIPNIVTTNKGRTICSTSIMVIKAKNLDDAWCNFVACANIGNTFGIIGPYARSTLGDFLNDTDEKYDLDPKFVITELFEDCVFFTALDG